MLPAHGVSYYPRCFDFVKVTFILIFLFSGKVRRTDRYKKRSSTITTRALEDWLSQAIGAHPGQRPWVTVSYAQSLDGCLAARRGAPTAISGPESRTLTHRLRALHAAILVGIGTILSDNPRLTTRLTGGPSPRPVILDGALRTPLNASVFEHPLAPVIACREDTEHLSAELLRTAGAQILPLPTDSEGRLVLTALLDALGGMGIRSLMVEGGAATLTSFLAAGLADALVVTIAPRLLGGQPALLAPPARQLYQPQFTPCGEDFIFWGALV